MQVNEGGTKDWELDRTGLVIFLAAVAIHGLLLVQLGRPWPAGLRGDSNVYLELAMNLWRDHSWGTRVATDYPPLYPTLIAPAFAIAGNAARFAFIYFLHSIVLGAASLALVPALQRQLGARRAWLTVAALQFLGATMFHGYSTQTECLFAALIVAATGIAWQAWNRPSFGRWVLLGFLCGLAVCTRRTGLVLPVALGMLWLADVLAARRDGAGIPWRAGLAMAGGFVLGLLPEIGVVAVTGEAIVSYGGNPVKGHLKAAVDSASSLQGLVWAFQVTGRHVAYSVILTFGAPLAIILLLLRRRSPAPLPLRRAAAFALLVVLGLIAMTSLHILRDYLKDLAYYDLYPRYVDPPELALVTMGLLSFLWLRSDAAEQSSLRQRIGRSSLLAGSVLGVLALTGPLQLSRGGHYPKLATIESWGLPPWLAGYFLLLVGVVALAAWVATWSLRSRLFVVPLVLSLLASWSIGAPGAATRLFSDPGDRRPRVLQLAPLEREAQAPLAIVVHRPGRAGRYYYEPAFRSDHPVWFVGPRGQLEEWLREHPQGFVLVYKRDRKRKRSGDLQLVSRGRKWLVYRSSAAVDPPRDAR